MTTFTAFKKRIAVGTVLYSDNHKRPHVTGERPVTKVQGNGIWYSFTADDGQVKQGFTGWPAASDVRINEDGSATFLDGTTKEPVFTYHIRDTMEVPQ